jgi:intracellular septation protein A
MSSHFEMPRLRTMARHALPNLVEGSIVPVALFFAMLHLFGLQGAMIAALAWSYAAVVRRVVTRQRIPGLVLISAVTLTARSALALSTGSTVVYFLQPTLGTALVAVAFLLSVALGRPLAMRIATDFCPIPSHVMAQDHVRRCFLGISLLWAVIGFVNASVAVWLQFTQSVGTFVLTKSLASGALTVLAVAISVLWFRRSVARPALIPVRSLPSA